MNARQIAPIAITLILGAGSYWWVTSDMSPSAVYLCTHTEYRSFIDKLNWPGFFLGIFSQMIAAVISESASVDTFRVREGAIWFGVLVQWAVAGLLISWLLNRKRFP